MYLGRDFMQVQKNERKSMKYKIYKIKYFQALLIKENCKIRNMLWYNEKYDKIM